MVGTITAAYEMQTYDADCGREKIMFFDPCIFKKSPKLLILGNFQSVTTSSFFAKCLY